MLCCKFLNFRETKSEKIANPPTEEEGPAGIKSPFNTTGQIRDSRDSGELSEAEYWSTCDTE